ncbi:MAG: hypothetical protein ACQESR_23745 [Planctomycetota bacterium]
MTAWTLSAKADYTTTCLLSFDWVIDASDEIHLLRVEESEPGDAPVARLVKTFKQSPDVEPQNETQLQAFGAFVPIMQLENNTL